MLMFCVCLPVVLRLKKAKFFFNSVARLGYRKFKRLTRLVGSLKIIKIDVM